MKKTLPQLIQFIDIQIWQSVLTNELITSVCDEQHSCLCRDGISTQVLMNLEHLLNTHSTCMKYISYKIGKE